MRPRCGMSWRCWRGSLRKLNNLVSGVGSWKVWRWFAPQYDQPFML